MSTFTMNSSGSGRLLLDRKWKHLALHIKAMRLISFRRNFLSSVLFLTFVLVSEMTAAEQGLASRQNRGAKVADSDRRCSEVQLLLESKVKDAGNISEESPVRPGVCHRGSDVCCTNRMEHQLVARSRTQVDKIINDRTKLLRQTFFTWTAKFDTFFRELIERSKRSLHDLFLHSYGEIFQQNNQIFVQLYHDLMSHYKSADLSLGDSLDRFFSSLFQRMFRLLNDQYVIDAEFFDCLVEHTETLRPFDDFPDRIASQVGRTFMVARTFAQGLSEGKAVILSTTKQPPNDRCLHGVTQMLFCPLCQGLSSAKPCVGTCVRTASKCLRLQIELLDDWNYYLESLLRVAETLSKSFSIESVVGLLDSLISDAVDNFQANVVNVTSVAFSVCGKPPLASRKRRETELKEETTSEFHSFLLTNSSSSSSSFSLSSSPRWSFMESSSSSPMTKGTPTTSQLFTLSQEETKDQLEEENEEQNRRQQSREEQKQQQPRTGQENRPKRRHTKTRNQRRQKQDRRQEEEQDEEQDEQEAEQHQEGQRQELRHRTEGERDGQQRQQKQTKTSEHQQQQQQQQNRRPKQQKPPKKEPAEVEETLTPLQELVRDFRLKLNSVKDIWARLPLSVCESWNAVQSNETTCWNGVELTSGSADEDTWSPGRNTEPDSSAPTSIAKKEMLRLRNVAAKLRQASIGWDDDQETDDGGSGLDFGSGTELGPKTLPDIRTSQWPEAAAASTAENSTRNRPQNSSRASTQRHLVAAISVLSSILLLLFQ